MKQQGAEASLSRSERILSQVAAIRSSADFVAVERQLLIVLGQECAAETAELHVHRHGSKRIETVFPFAEQPAAAQTPLERTVAASSCADSFELTWAMGATSGTIVLRSGTSVSLSSAALIPVREIVARHVAEILETSYELAEVEAARADLQQREALLRATRASLAVTHELGRTGNYRFNLVTHSNWWSEEVFRFYGLDPHTTKLTLDVFRSGIHEDDRDRLLHEIGESFHNRTARTTHYRTRHPGGVVRYVMTSFRPANDEPDGDFIGTNVDLTDRRIAIERTRAVQAELARMLRISMLNELASSLILGISQPLTAIVASAAAALRWLDHAPQHQEEVKASLASINPYRERVDRYIGILRSLASRAIPEVTLVSLDRAIGDVVAIAVNEAETRGISFECSLGCGDSQVLGDRSQIQQLFLSLAAAAFRVAKIGHGGERRVSAATASDASGQVKVLVAFDASDEACEIFDLSADSADVAGSNAEIVDLWLSRTIAESYFGTLTMEGSDTGRKQFVVRLPAQPDTSNQSRDEESE